MSRPVIERRLTEVGERLQRLRADLAVAEEQLAHLTAEAEDARVRSLVSETAQSGSVHRDAERHARAMERHRDDVMADIARLEVAQDALLDRMGADPDKPIVIGGNEVGTPSGAPDLSGLAASAPPNFMGVACPPVGRRPFQSSSPVFVSKARK